MVGMIVGIITDSATHAAPFRGQGKEHARARATISDSNGVYRMVHPEADRFTLTATRTGYLAIY